MEQIPKKYTKEYLERRIEALRQKIATAIPSKDLVDPDDIFSSMLKSYEWSKESLQACTTVLEGLQKGEEDHPHQNNPVSVDPTSLIDAAKHAVDTAQKSVNNLSQTATKVGCNAVTSSGLLKILRTNKDLQQCLFECTVLVQSTTTKLAAWCAEDPDQHHALLDVFLADIGCMKAFLLAGGPVHGNFGPALVLCGKLHLQMKQKGEEEENSKRSKLLERLALAVALEHASPIPIWKHENTDQVNPVQRFWHYADAHLDGALDATFDQLSVWEMRMVVDSNATHEDLTWAREYLKAYRPDEILTADEHWRYALAVRSDVGYRQPDHDFTNYKDLLSAGGKCGARAWFGRFICKAWGIPTWGIRQPGHAAMTRWTTDGWCICLGAAKWDISWWDETRFSGEKKLPSRYGPDFLEEAMAREAGSTVLGQSYEDVVMLECLAESFGETIESDYASGKFWRSLALAKRKRLAQSLSSRSICEKRSVTATTVSNSSFHEGATVDENGTVVIPAASFVKESSGVSVMDSFWGGKQIHFAKQQDAMVEYDVPSSIKEGRYRLSLKIVNVHRDQVPMEICVDDSSLSSSNDPEDFEVIPGTDPQQLQIPYTIGRWETTKEQINVNLSPGKKILLSRKIPCWGLTMKEIVLTPL
ncbi:hypothetical protein IV203_011872 [Nitzschia inconspicua]|uniref:Uncharacterized protein n=1 Tax=Nitzschia inconspicua TaxID=303405 RepID=A0A9K3KU77_9STRA|nr:hypothetical protein IV203_011872 [Nitzschia inconspicua]